MVVPLCPPKSAFHSLLASLQHSCRPTQRGDISTGFEDGRIHKCHYKLLKQYQCNWRHKRMSNVHWSISPLVYCSIVPFVHWSICLLVHWSISPLVHSFIGPLVHWSICPLVHWSFGPLVHCSIGPSVHRSIGPLFHWSIGPLVHCSIGPSVHCSIVPLVHRSIGWMSNVKNQMSNAKGQ